MHGRGQLGVATKLAILAVDGDEIAWLHQIDDELEFFLAGVSADVYGRRGAIFVDDVRLTAEHVVDHAVDSLFVAGDDARRKHHSIAGLDAGVLVIVNGGAGKGAHGLALRAADEHADFFRRIIFDLAGMNEQAVGNLDVVEVLGDFGGVGHGAANHGHFAAVFGRQLQRQLDAMNGRRETGDKDAAFGAGKHFLELAAHGTLAGRIAGALHVGGILKKR